MPAHHAATQHERILEAGRFEHCCRAGGALVGLADEDNRLSFGIPSSVTRCGSSGSGTLRALAMWPSGPGDPKRVDRDDHGVGTPALPGLLPHDRGPQAALRLSPSSSCGQIAQKVTRARPINIATERNDNPHPNCDMPPERSSTQPTSSCPTNPPA